VVVEEIGSHICITDQFYTRATIFYPWPLGIYLTNDGVNVTI
jgi:hypothetical protein